MFRSYYADYLNRLENESVGPTLGLGNYVNLKLSCHFSTVQAIHCSSQITNVTISYENVLRE
jgi:hypothetical protein